MGAFFEIDTGGNAAPSWIFGDTLLVCVRPLDSSLGED